MHKKRKLPGFTQAPASPRKKCAMKMKETNKEEKKRRARKNIIDERRAFIGYLRKTRAMDINQLQLDDC